MTSVLVISWVLLLRLPPIDLSPPDIDYLRSVLPATTEEEFFTYLHELDTREVTMYAVPEGSVVFPKVPVIRLEGPLPIVQLLETTMLTLVNYAKYCAQFLSFMPQLVIHAFKIIT